jgi:hypothetical protein
MSQDMFTKLGITILGATIGLLSFPALLRPSRSAGKEGAQAEDRGLTQIKLQLRTIGNDEPKTDKFQYKSSEEVEVQVLATNSNSQPFALVQSTWFVNYVPELWRSGELISYSKAMERRLVESRRMEKNLADPHAIVRDSSIVVRLLPNVQRKAGLIRLSPKYDKM